MSYDRTAVFRRDRRSCAYCDGTFPDHLLHVDHIVPKSKGGTDDMENLITACSACNQLKGNRDAMKPKYGLCPWCGGRFNDTHEGASESRRCDYCNRRYHAVDCYHCHVMDGGPCGESHAMRKREPDHEAVLCEICDQYGCEDLHIIRIGGDA